MTSKKTGSKDEHAISFFGMAEQYQRAADLVYVSDKTLTTPVYFMYLHAIELALKAFLRAADFSIVKGRKHHGVVALYKECQTLGLKMAGHDSADIGNVINLLEDANEEQGLRYFRSKGAAFPELSWMCDAVKELLQAVEPSVNKKAEADGLIPGQAVKLNLIVSKPVPKS